MDYPAALLAENRSFGELAGGADPATRVPTCPGWTMQQLFRHVGRGDRWAAQIVIERVDDVLDPRTVPEGKPPEDTDGAIAWLEGGARKLIDAVDQAGADTPVWTFLGPRPASWWVRRRLHEATVHRADAAFARGLAYHLAPELAADGISEFLERVAIDSGADDSAPPLGAGQTLHLHATDDGLGPDGEWTIRGGPDGVSWSHEHGRGTAALRGPAKDLLLMIVRRLSVDDVDVEVLGERGVWDTWLERTPF